MVVSLRNVRFTPKSGHRSPRRECPLCAKSGHQAIVHAYSIYFIGKLLELLRHFEAERLGGRQIDDELVFCWRLNWEVDRLFTLKNMVGVCRGIFRRGEGISS